MCVFLIHVIITAYSVKTVGKTCIFFRVRYQLDIKDEFRKQKNWSQNISFQVRSKNVSWPTYRFPSGFSTNHSIKKNCLWREKLIKLKYMYLDRIFTPIFKKKKQNQFNQWDNIVPHPPVFEIVYTKKKAYSTKTVGKPYILYCL